MNLRINEDINKLYSDEQTPKLKACRHIARFPTPLCCQVSLLKAFFPLGILTREDGTDTLSQNVGK
jgi:hypothetical protein